MAGKQLVIKTLYAFLMRDDTGEGLCGQIMPDGVFMPFIGADLDRVSSVEQLAQKLADSTGKTIQLVHFTAREDVKLITPNRVNPGPPAVDLGDGLMGLRQ